MNTTPRVIHRYNFANTVSDLLTSREGFGLVATSDPYADEQFVASIEPYLRLGDGPGGRRGELTNCTIDGHSYLIWKIGGLRDHRGRPGGRAAEVLGPVEDTLHPALLPRLMGTDSLPADASLTMAGRFEPFTWATAEADLDPPAAELTQDGYFQGACAALLEGLAAGRRRFEVEIGGHDPFLVWQALWAMLPGAAQSWMRIVTTADHPDSTPTDESLVVSLTQGYAQAAAALAPATGPLSLSDTHDPETCELFARRALESYLALDVAGMAGWLGDGALVDSLQEFGTWVKGLPSIDGELIMSYDQLIEAALKNPERLSDGMWRTVARSVSGDRAYAVISEVVQVLPHAQAPLAAGLHERLGSGPQPREVWRSLIEFGQPADVAADLLAHENSSEAEPVSLFSAVSAQRAKDVFFHAVAAWPALEAVSVCVTVVRSLPSFSAGIDVLGNRIHSDPRVAEAVLERLAADGAADDIGLLTLYRRLDADVLTQAWLAHPDMSKLPYGGPVIDYLLSHRDKRIRRTVFDSRVCPALMRGVDGVDIGWTGALAAVHEFMAPAQHSETGPPAELVRPDGSVTAWRAVGVLAVSFVCALLVVLLLLKSFDLL